MKSSKIKHLLCFTIIFLLFCAGNADAKNPLPEFFGVYALYNGKLVELQSHPQSQYAISGMTVMGADVLSQLSGITFPEGTIEFIIFRDSATTFNKIPLSKIARIDMQANTAWGGDGTKKRLKNSYHLMSENIYMNVAPLKEMMVRVVPKSTLSPGIWAIKIGSELYDFVVGSEESADCVIRKVGATGVKYIPCSKNQRTNSFKSGNDTIASDANNYLPANITIDDINAVYMEVKHNMSKYKSSLINLITPRKTKSFSRTLIYTSLNSPSPGTILFFRDNQNDPFLAKVTYKMKLKEYKTYLRFNNEDKTPIIAVFVSADNRAYAKMLDFKSIILSGNVSDKKYPLDFSAIGGGYEFKDKKKTGMFSFRVKTISTPTKYINKVIFKSANSYLALMDLSRHVSYPLSIRFKYPIEIRMITTTVLGSDGSTASKTFRIR